MSEYEREDAAIAALARWMAESREVERLHELAGMPIPPPVERVLGRSVGRMRVHSGTPIGGSGGGVRVERPNEWQSGWMWLDAKDTSLNVLVLAILRDAQGPVAPRKMVERISEYRPNVAPGSIYNVGPRLENAGKIRRNEGWEVIDEALAPVLHNGILWGPPDVFEKYDLAAVRRRMIVDILQVEPDGVMIVQLTRKLEANDEWGIPISKDLVKVDVQVMMQAGLVKRGGGHSKKWRLVDAE